MKPHRGGARLCCGLVAALVFMAPWTASAQHVIYALVPQGYSVDFPPPTGPTNLVRVRIDGDRLGPVVTLGTMPGIGGHISVTAGGRFVLWTTSEEGHCRLGIFDTVAQVNTLSVCSETAPLVDPLRERVIVSFGGRLSVFDANGLAPIPNTEGITPLAMSTDGRRVFALRVVNNALELGAIDVTTGSIAWSIPLGGATFKVVNEDESLVFVTANNSRILRALDTNSGAVAHEMAMPDTGNPFVLPGDRQAVVDTAGQRLVMALSYTSGFNPPLGAYWTVDIATWTEVSRVSVPGPPRLVQGRATGDIFGTAQQSPKTPYSTCSGSDFARVTADSGAIVPLSPIAFGPCVSWDVAFAPGAPELRAASVSGRNVTLAWTQGPGVTTGGVIEAGSAPGLTNLATLPVGAGQTTMTVTDVPAGAYYVRVRTQNHAGPSAPSNEIIVVVP